MSVNTPAGNVLVVDDNVDFQSLVADFARMSRCRAS